METMFPSTEELMTGVCVVMRLKVATEEEEEGEEKEGEEEEEDRGIQLQAVVGVGQSCCINTVEC